MGNCLEVKKEAKMTENEIIQQDDIEDIFQRLSYEDSQKLRDILLEKQNSNFYVIIPNDILDDKDIPIGAKLLYGRIISLTNSDGFCYATNKYLANKCKTSERNIQRWLQILVDKMYVYCENVKSGIGEIILIKIFIKKEAK